VFRETKVSDLDMTVIGEKDVFRLEITVDDVVCVEVVERHSHFSGIELGHRVREPLEKKMRNDIRWAHRDRVNRRRTPL